MKYLIFFLLLFSCTQDEHKSIYEFANLYTDSVSHHWELKTMDDLKVLYHYRGYHTIPVSDYAELGTNYQTGKMVIITPVEVYHFRDANVVLESLETYLNEDLLIKEKL